MNVYQFSTGLILIILIVFCITQILMPILDQRPMFPLFRRRRRKLEAQIVKDNEVKDELAMKRQLKKRTRR